MGQAGFLIAAAILGGAGVGIGAFAAHGLKETMAPELLPTFETGVRYHFYHALALLALALAPQQLWTSTWASAAGYLWIAGIAIFSGSLYIFALTGIRWLGAITPIGGTAFILGWICLAVAAKALRS